MRIRRLAQQALAIDYLIGVDADELDARSDEGKKSGRGSARYTALGVATAGARYAKQQVLQIQKEGSEVVEEFSVPIDRYADLDGFIQELYHDNRISAGRAKALLLLFEQRTSHAPIEVQRRVALDLCNEISRKLRATIPTQPHKGDQLLDKTFERGVEYIRTVMSSPLRRINGVTPMSFVVGKEAYRAEDSKISTDEVRASAHGHIGYVLDKLYLENHVY